MKTIIVPVDLSAAATRVCDAACTLAKLSQARLVLLHVIKPLPILVGDYYTFNAGAVAAAAAAGEKSAARRLHALGRRCTQRGVQVQTIQRTDLPVPCILAKTAACKAAYIVIGSHGHGAVYDLFAGSTTHGVLRRARCPVLVIPINPARSRPRR